MKKSRDSLSGQNTGGRAAGPGSSPGLSTKQRSALWQRLRRLDRLCTRYEPVKPSPFVEKIWRCFITLGLPDKKRQALFDKYDQQRKDLRNKLKRYKP